MATASMALKEFKFTGIPAHLPAGPTTFKIANAGRQVHHLEFIRLDPGKTKKDVMRALMSNTQPKWAHNAGGMDVISPKHTAWLTLNLAAGKYIAICFMPDTSKADMRPHAAEGMISSFTVG